LKNCPLCEGQIVSWDPLQRLEDVSPRFDTLGCLEDQESDPFIAKSNTKKRCKKLIPQNSGGEDYSMGDGFRSDDDKMPTWLVHSKAEGEGLDGVGDVTEVNSENQGAWPADEKFQAPNEGGEVNGEKFRGVADTTRIECEPVTNIGKQLGSKKSKKLCQVPVVGRSVLEPTKPSLKGPGLIEGKKFHLIAEVVGRDIQIEEEPLKEKLPTRKGPDGRQKSQVGPASALIATTTRSSRKATIPLKFRTM
jgi:hypothetical protein